MKSSIWDWIDLNKSNKNCENNFLSMFLSLALISRVTSNQSSKVKMRIEAIIFNCSLD